MPASATRVASRPARGRPTARCTFQTFRLWRDDRTPSSVCRSAVAGDAEQWMSERDLQEMGSPYGKIVQTR
eukprot:COSAG01_NODE_20003_length_976_cov_15.330673_1_plen_70_part_10